MSTAERAYRVYRALPAPVRAVGERMLRWRAERQVRSTLPAWGGATTRLLVAPLNTAGQGWCWARAVESADPAARAISVHAHPRGVRTALDFPVDVELTQAMQLRGLAPYRALALGATHALVEAGVGVLTDVHHRSMLDDLDQLTDSGVRVAVVLHGSEVRDLRAHAERYPASPFRGEWDDRWYRMQERVDRTVQLLDRLRERGVPLLVSTPDLLEHVPDATWIPVVVDVDAFGGAGTSPPLTREQPVVLHAPSNPRLKGTAVVDQALGDLAAAGRVRYRRLEGVAHAQMPAALAAADIVIDQVVLGNPGVLLAETLAAGRVAVAHLSDPVRSALKAGDGVEEIPVVQADAAGLRETIEQLLADPDEARTLAAQGPAWARRNHDGRRSAAALWEAFG